jgi:hypothetical protein
MHTGAAVLFGIFLGVDHGWMAMARGVAALLVAASAAGMFVFGSVVALQSACLAIAGPRRFARAGAALQVLLVAVVTTTLLVTPALSRGAMSIGDEAASTAWLSLIPPIWFLGLYETLAGTASSGMRELARTATIAVVTAGLAVVFFYPIACWRVLTSAVAAGAVATRPWTRSVGSWNVRLLATKPGTRAALQFLIATAGRVSRFRLVLSAAVGLGLTLVAPIALYWMARGGPARPQVSLLAVPLLLTIALVAGLRVIVAMPSELAAGWMFRSTPLEGFAGRVAARRLLFVFGVLAPIAMAMPVWVAFWGMAAAWPFVVNTLLAGGILVEAHLWGFAGVPCTRPMAVSDSNLQGRWPFYAIGLLVYGVGIPGIEAQTAGHWSAWLLTIVLLTAYFVLRTTSDEAARINVVTDYQRGLLLLDLARVPQAAAGARPAGPMRVERGVRS